MRKKITLNKNTFTEEDYQTNNPISILTIISLLSIALFFSIIIIVSMSVKNNRELNKTVELYERQISQLEDSLTFELTYAKTLVEKCNLHTKIGQAMLEKPTKDEISEDSVWNYIKSLDVWYPQYIMAQAIIESQCGKKMPDKSNNMFGMTIPSKRETTAIPKHNENDVYARYKNWKLSVIDRILWELYIFDNIMPNEDEYIKSLGTYASSPTYIDAVKSTAKRLQ